MSTHTNYAGGTFSLSGQRTVADALEMLEQCAKRAERDDAIYAGHLQVAFETLRDALAEKGEKADTLALLAQCDLGSASPVALEALQGMAQRAAAKGEVAR